MAIHSRYINGNLVFYSDYMFRVVNAIGAGVVRVSEEFQNTPFSSADNMAACTTTLVEGGAGETTVALKGGAQGGTLLITTDAAENDGANINWQGEAFDLSGSYPLYFGIRAKVSDATQSDFLFGLSITSTDMLGGVTDGLYFRKADGSTQVVGVLEKDSTETSTNLNTLDTGWHIYEFFFDGSAVELFVDGASYGKPAVTNLPNDEYLTVGIQFLTGAAAAITCEIDWVRAYQFI